MSARYGLWQRQNVNSYPSQWSQSAYRALIASAIPMSPKATAAPRMKPSILAELTTVDVLEKAQSSQKTESSYSAELQPQHLTKSVISHFSLSRAWHFMQMDFPPESTGNAMRVPAGQRTPHGHVVAYFAVMTRRSGLLDARVAFARSERS